MSGQISQKSSKGFLPHLASNIDEPISELPIDQNSSIKIALDLEPKPLKPSSSQRLSRGGPSRRSQVRLEVDHYVFEEKDDQDYFQNPVGISVPSNYRLEEDEEVLIDPNELV